jgi:hypothetical protein
MAITSDLVVFPGVILCQQGGVHELSCTIVEGLGIQAVIKHIKIMDIIIILICMIVYYPENKIIHLDE